jgi:pilus assembly protein CpaB
VKARLLGGIAALVVAIIGTVMLVFYVQGADKRALANTETEDVYVVQKDIPAGTDASKFGDSIIKKAVPKSALAADSVANLSDLGSKVSSIEFKPGEQLLASRMVEPASLLGRGRAKVPTGLQEVTLKLPIERVVGGVLQAGDTVGVLLSFEAEENTNVPSQTQLTFHKVLVTAVQLSNGTTTETEQSEGSEGGALSAKKAANTGGGYLVTLARPSADIERLVFASEFGTIYLSKEPSEAVEGNTGVMDRGKAFR